MKKMNASDFTTDAVQSEKESRFGKDIVDKILSSHGPNPNASVLTLTLI